MRQVQSTITVATRGAGLYEFTGDVERAVSTSQIDTGLLTLFCQHTSASLLVQENADPDVQHDLLAFFHRLVPEGMDWVTHDAEGPDDMPAHIRAALTQTSLTIPVAGGRLALGTWQGIYLFEHRRRPHRRNVVLHLIGE
jgi:secondary thiamine-phosphate synthase enzyme